MQQLGAKKIASSSSWWLSHFICCFLSSATYFSLAFFKLSDFMLEHKWSLLKKVKYLVLFFEVVRFFTL